MERPRAAATKKKRQQGRKKGATRSEEEVARLWKDSSASSRGEWQHDSRVGSTVVDDKRREMPPQVLTLDEVSYDRSEQWCSKPASSRRRRGVDAHSRLFLSATNDASANLTPSHARKALDANAPVFLPGAL